MIGVFFLGSSPTLVTGYLRKEYRAGVEAMRKKQWEKAESHFRRFLDLVQKRPWLKKANLLSLLGMEYNVEALTYCNLAMLALHREDQKMGRRYLELSVKSDPCLGLAHFRLGWLNYSATHPLASARCFRNARAFGISEEAFDHTVSLIVDQVLEAQRSTEGQASTGRYVGMGQVYSHLGMMSDAARCYKHAVSRSEAGSLQGWITTLLRMGRPLEVQRDIAWLEQHEPDGEETHHLLAAYHCMLGDFEKALSHDDRVVARAADLGIALANKAETLLVAGRWIPAEETARRALEVGGENATAHAVLAQLAVREKRWADGLAHAETAAALNLRIAWGVEAKAYCLYGLQRSQEALEAFVLFLDIAEFLSPFEANLELRMAQAWKMVEELREEINHS